jgi:hypothetical protein
MLCKVYFGLHFYLVRLVILREQPCIIRSRLFQIRTVYENLTFSWQYCNLA